uniref:Uncharacterized protein n=1 Tax=Acrobeloides nanus TaxID=290746 RepID=A0A914D4K2_9BILA
MWTNLNIFLFCIVYAASTDETFKSDTKFWQFNLCTPLEIYFLASLSGHIDCHGNPPDLETTSVGVDVDGQEPWATTINSTGSFIVEYSWPKMNTEYGKDGIKTDLTFLLPNVIINFDGSIIELLDNSWKVSWSSPGFMEYVVKDTKKLDLRQNCQATVDVKLFYTFASADKRNPMYFILYDKTDFQ